MKIIEKIVDELLSDGFYTFGIGALIVILCVIGSLTYKDKLNTEIELAKIAAGHFECKCK
jgi:hypothetical protein